MAHHHRCLVAFIAILVTIIVGDISAIKCWRCSSKDSEFCWDFLDHRNFTQAQIQWHLVRCGPVRKKFDYKGDKMIAKCMARIDLVDERLVYTRKCVEEAQNAGPNSCLSDEWFNDSDNPNNQLMSCETCTDEDGCNNRINNYFGTESSVDKVGSANLLIQTTVAVCLLITLIYSRCKM